MITTSPPHGTRARSRARTAPPSQRRFRAALVAFIVALPLVLVQLASPQPAAASHYRANQLTWHLAPGSTDTVEFHLTGAIRWSFHGNPPVGSTVNEFTLDFGDGTSEFPDLTVTSVDPANDVFTFEAHVSHTYASPGPFVASTASCCRLSSFNGHVNNGDGNLSIETIVDLAQTSASPVSSISPIVDCPATGVCNFFVPAVDPDGQALRWRFSSAAEAGSGFFDQPAGATIDPSTGLYTWDTTGATINPDPMPTFYSTQVTIENLVGGVVVSKAAVDFFIRLGTGTTNQAPVFTTPTPADGAVIPATVGSPVTFGTAAQDPDTGDTVTVNVLGIPSGGSFAATPGNPATGTFTWTPTAVGDTILTLTAQDQNGLGALQRSVIIRATAGTNQPPTSNAGPDVSGTEGAPIALDGTVGDADGDALTTVWSYTPGAGVDAGATCAFAAASAVDTTITCTDDGEFVATLTVSDGKSSAVADSTVVTVTNVAPTVVITAPSDGSTWNVGATVAITAPIVDLGSNDTHTCSVDWGDGTTSTGSVAGGVCSASHVYATLATPTVTVTVTDDDGASGSASIMLIVPDSTTKVTGGGFVTDGGRASFGFVAKTTDSGGYAGQIQVRSGKDRFHGYTVTALTTTSNTASWRGAGRWNGADGYSFEVSVVDNRPGGRRKATAPDEISVVIRDGAGNVVLAFAGPLQGGNLKVH